METLQNIFIDSLNGFSMRQIPLFLFQLLCAALGGYLFQLVFNKKWNEKLVSYGALTALAVAVLASLAKYSLPIAVLAAAAVLLLVKGKEDKKLTTIGQFILVLIGIGCGVGSVVQTIIGAVLIMLVVLFLPMKK